jgi:pimeloyl-ACP methyl ester carboxylesterase
LVEITIPEQPNQCLALIPGNYTPQVACGVLVHLPVPGAFDRDAFAAQWRSLCQQQDLIVLAPQPQMPAGWSPTEVEFLRKAIENVAGRYTVDRSRIVVYGYQGSGTMAILSAFRHRDLIRGVVAVDAAAPAHLRLPDNDPLERLAIYLAVPTQSKQRDRAEATAAALRELKYSVIVRELSGASRQLNDAELQEVARWVDTLDRI